MKAIPFLAILAPLAIQAQTGQFISFTNQYGPHANVKVVRVTETMLIWRDTNSGNGGSVKLADLPENLRARLRFDPAKAAQVEQRNKEQQEAFLKQQAALEAQAAKLSHWEELAMLSMEPSTWSRYRCLVKTQQDERRTVLVANLPSEAASLPKQIADAQVKASALSQQIQTYAATIASRQSAVDRADAVTPVGASGDANYVNAVMAQRAQVNLAQVDLNNAADRLATMRIEYQDQLNNLSDLKRRLSAVKFRAFFTGHYFDGLQLWDCAPAK